MVNSPAMSNSSAPVRHSASQPNLYSSAQQYNGSQQYTGSQQYNTYTTLNSSAPIVNTSAPISSSGQIGNSSLNSTGSGVQFCAEILTLMRGKEAEKRQILSFLLQEKQNPTNHAKEVYLQVTDKLDPFTFFSLCLTEEDFQQLKTSQGLLVDFSSFPSMLRQLLTRCREEADNHTPAFALVLNNNNNSHNIEVTELNMFKHLCHLSLIVVKASDHQLKEYLADCIKQLKNDLGSSCSQLSSVQQQLVDRQRQSDQLSEQLESVRREQQQSSSSLGQKMMNDIQMEKEKCNKKVTELQNRFEVERREAENRHTRSLEQLENRVASLDVQNRDLLEGKYRGESTLRELRSKLSAREEELKRTEAELHSTTRDKGQVEARGREENRRVQELENRAAGLEENLREKERELQRSRELATLVTQEKEDLAQELKEKTGTVTRRESAVRSVTDELMKGNQIIRKLQDQLKQEQNKAKLRGKIAAEQEKLLSDKDEELSKVREELREASQVTHSKGDQLSQLEENLEQLHQKNEQLETLNRSNENVINWLNKQLASFKSAEATIGRGGVAATRGKARGGVARKSTSDVNSGQFKENDPLVGLDPKYFEHSTPGGTVARSEIPDVTRLPTNIKRGGLLRR